MCHVTRYCNLIGPHCTVRRDTACIAVHQTLPSLVEVGLACKTSLLSGICIVPLLLDLGGGEGDTSQPTEGSSGPPPPPPTDSSGMCNYMLAVVLGNSACIGLKFTRISAHPGAG